MSCKLPASCLSATVAAPFLIAAVLCILSINAEEDDALYSNVWAVHIKGGLQKAKQLADDHGFMFGDEVGSY